MNVSTAIVHLRYWAAGRSGGIRPPGAHASAAPLATIMEAGTPTPATLAGCFPQNVVGNGRDPAALYSHKLLPGPDRRLAWPWWSRIHLRWTRGCGSSASGATRWQRR